MTKEEYIRMTDPFRRDSRKAWILEKINNYLTTVIFVSYPLMLLYLFRMHPDRLLRAVLVPLDGFIIVSVFRRMVNRRRPYETFELPPLIPKDTKGKSFPSRHVFSAMILALTFAFQPGCLVWGLILAAMAAVIAGVRVLSGVHYISDVLAGAGIGILFALIGFLL